MSDKGGKKHGKHGAASEKQPEENAGLLSNEHGFEDDEPEDVVLVAPSKDVPKNVDLLDVEVQR